MAGWGLEKRKAKKVEKQQNKGRGSKSDGEQRSTGDQRVEEARQQDLARVTTAQPSPPSPS